MVLTENQLIAQRILVVDDDKDITQLIQAGLKEEGFRGYQCLHRRECSGGNTKKSSPACHS